MFEVNKMTVELRNSPLGLDVEQPRFSYIMESDDQGVLQEARRIRVINGSVWDEEKPPIWDTGKEETSQSVHISYAGAPLQAKSAYMVKIEVWNNKGERAETITTWETGLMDESWNGRWITYDYKEDQEYNPAPCLRRDFNLKAGVAKARLYITARGLYEFHINGKRVGEDIFTPGCTDYYHRIQYQAYDVGSLLKKGANAMGALLGDGWYRGDYTKRRHPYGDHLSLLMEMDVVYEDGSKETFISDESFKSSPSFILKSDFYQGEAQDTNYDIRWSDAGFDDSAWSGTRVEDLGYEEVVCSLAPMVRKEEILAPVALITTPRGETVLDMGQNMVGWVQLTVNGEKGQKITLHHGEVLDRDGNFYTENLRVADQEVSYILNSEKQVLEPSFTFQGFRYVRVTGWDDIAINDVKGIVLHSSMEATGEFSCSHPLVNQLQKNIQWGQRGNFVDIPTDCPQRDERLGWTGDAQAFIGTASFNYNVDRFFTKWLADLAAEQDENGSVPHIIPAVLNETFGMDDLIGGATGWADAAVICPWTIYKNYGDKGILETQYSSMKKWVDYGFTRLDDDMIWRKDFQFADWLAKDWIQDFPTNFGATTPHLVSTAFLSYSLSLIIKSARILGYGEVEEYEKKFDRLKRAFHDEFVTPSGRIGSDTQTSYVLPLHFGLLDEETKAVAVDRLVKDIQSRGNHLSTGFLGTPYLCHVLTENGRNDVAYDLLLQEDYPGWLYPVTKGATTIWERWDGIKEDGSFQSVSMNSYNHYAYGAVGEWLYSKVAGLQADESEPGFKHFFVKPCPDERLTHAKLSYLSLYGKISIEWKIEKDRFAIEMTVPPNTRATYVDPVTGKETELLSGRHSLSSEWEAIRK